MTRPIYLDHHATTPVDPRVLDAMLPYFRDEYGNAASRSHRFGWNAESAVEAAREKVAALIGAEPDGIVFTSGATEANNLAIKGVAAANREKGRHAITAAVEHRSVLDPFRRLEREGALDLSVLPVDRHGIVDPAAVRASLCPQTLVVSIMAANNEIGTIEPIAEIAAVAKEKGVIFHTDATQAVGKIPIDVKAAGIDLLSFTAHKMYGPKGVGCLYVRRKSPRVRLAPLFDGGGHERGLRSGTLNVPGIVGFGKAAEICLECLADEPARIRALRDRLWRTISSRLDDVHVNGHPDRRLAGNLNVSFARVEGESLMTGLRDIAVSSGSACRSASPDPSHVLEAIGVAPDLAHASIRFGIGRFNTPEEIDAAAERVVAEVLRLREIAPVNAPAPLRSGAVVRAPGE